MVLKEIDQEVKGGVIKLLQLFNSPKLEKIITALRKSEYNDLKALKSVIEFDKYRNSKSLKGNIDESSLPNLERFDFTLYLSATEIYFEGNIQALLDEDDVYSTKFHQFRFNHPQSEGDIVEFSQFIQLALKIPKLKGKVDIRTPRTKTNKPQSFEEFLLKGHQLLVFGEHQDLCSIDNYNDFVAQVSAKRQIDGLLDFEICFSEEFDDLIHDDTDTSQLLFTLKNGNPQTLLEIGCNWSEFPPKQYKTAAEVFMYIRSVTEKYFGLKKQSTKTSTKGK